MATGDPFCPNHGFNWCDCPISQDVLTSDPVDWDVVQPPPSTLVSGQFFDKILSLLRKFGTCDRHQLDGMRREARSLLEEYKDEIEQYEKRKVHL